VDDLFWEAGFWFAVSGTITAYLIYRFVRWAFEDQEEE
jgi:uncharacterized membrane protein